MLTNHERVLMQMPQLFLKYDQRQMRSRFEVGGEFLYLTLLAWRYRVSLTAGTVEYLTDGGAWTPAGYYDAMTIYDLLCCAKADAELSGRYCRAENLPGAAYGANPAKDLLAPFAAQCDRESEKLASACRKLGGVPLPVGEISFRLALFDCLPVILQFWSSDDEFPPELKVMWDENTLRFLKFETLWYATFHLIDRLREEMNR